MDEQQQKLSNELRDARAGNADLERAGVEALQRLIPVARHHYTGQSGVVARFLLGLYNGSVWYFDLTDLRRLDAHLFDDCITLLRMDAKVRQRELHNYLIDGSTIFRELWLSRRPIAASATDFRTFLREADVSVNDKGRVDIGCPDQLDILARAYGFENTAEALMCYFPHATDDE